MVLSGPPDDHRRMDNRETVRVGGWCAMGGALASGVGNLLHPVTPRDDPVGVAEVIADSAAWTPIHLLIVVGLIVMTVGLVVIADVVATWPRCRALGRAAATTAIVGCTLGVLTVGVDGTAAKQLAEAWERDPDRVSLHAVTVNELVNFAMAGLFNVAFAGLPVILLGIALLRSTGITDWWGWAAVVPGIYSVLAGGFQLMSGRPTTLSLILTIVGPTLITVWTFLAGLRLVRGGFEHPRSVATSITTPRREHA